MALINCHFFSETLGIQTDMTVLLPQTSSVGQIGVSAGAARAEPPVLWLLHGLSDDHSIWLRRTSIERYAAERGWVVIMPNVHRSFYSNMVYGGAYWTYISEELPAIARSFFSFSQRREDCFVAGLSMGGYGAFKLALRQPQRFAAACSLSGVLDLQASAANARTVTDAPLRKEALRLVFGSELVVPPEDDLMQLADRVQNCPRLLQLCGTEDFLYPDNLRFQAHASALGLPLDYREGPGAHDWAYWDSGIQTALAWFCQGR